MPERKYSTGNNYRYGFNGKEKLDEMPGDGNIYDYGFRIYNPRIGKFLSVDPLAQSYPWNSTYAFAENDVLRCIDLDGLEKLVITEHFDKDNFLHHTIIYGIRDKDNKQAVNMRMKSASGVKLTTQDVYIIRKNNRGKITFEGPGGSLNNEHKKMIRDATTKQGVEDESLPENTMQQTENTNRGGFVESALIDNRSNEFFGSTVLNPRLKDKIKDLTIDIEGLTPSFYLTGDNSSISGKIYEGDLSKGFAELPGKIKADGSIKSIDVIIPMIISTNLSSGEQNNIRLGYEILGNNIKKELLKSGVRENDIHIQRPEYMYTPAYDEEHAVTNRPTAQQQIILKR